MIQRSLYNHLSWEFSGVSQQKCLPNPGNQEHRLGGGETGPEGLILWGTPYVTLSGNSRHSRAEDFVRCFLDWGNGSVWDSSIWLKHPTYTLERIKLIAGSQCLNLMMGVQHLIQAKGSEPLGSTWPPTPATQDTHRREASAPGLTPVGFSQASSPS